MELPNLSFGSVSLTSTINRSKAETTKNESKIKIDFNTIQNPISPKNAQINDSSLNFYASPDGNSVDRTITEMGNVDNLASIPLD
jgi:hypothetical protein